MLSLLDRLSSGELIAVISIITGGIVVLTFILSIAKYQLQSLADETSLKREKQEADLSLRSKLIEQATTSGDKLNVLLATEIAQPRPVVISDDLDGKLAKGFGMLEISTEEIEETVSQALTLDPNRKKAIISVIGDLLEEGASHESILAAVRGLCASSKSKVKETESPVAVPAM